MFYEIDDYNISGYNLLTISENEVKSFESHKYCPACGSNKSNSKVAFSLGLNSWASTLDFGVCNDCFHAYYLNPPNQKFFEDYYTQSWKQQIIRSKLALKVAPKNKMRDLLSDVGSISKSVSILDIGCGRAGQLLGLKQAGYNNLFGCEQSRDLARIGNHFLPGKIKHAGFQDLPDDMKFDIICSNHVLEHIRNPYEMFKKVSKILSKGGLFVISVPSQLMESLIHQTLCFDHLHSFNSISLRKLGKRAGFEMSLWKGNRVDEFCCIFQHEGEKFEPTNPDRFCSSFTDQNEQFKYILNRFKKPWAESNNGVNIISSGQPRYYNNLEFRFQGYSRITFFQKRAIRLFGGLVAFFNSIGFKLAVRETYAMMRRFFKGKYELAHYNYVEFHTKTDAKDKILIGFKNNQVGIFMK